MWQCEVYLKNITEAFSVAARNFRSINNKKFNPEAHKNNSSTLFGTDKKAIIHKMAIRLPYPCEDEFVTTPSVILARHQDDRLNRMTKLHMLELVFKALEKPEATKNLKADMKTMFSAYSDSDDDSFDDDDMDEDGDNEIFHDPVSPNKISPAKKRRAGFDLRRI